MIIFSPQITCLFVVSGGFLDPCLYLNLHAVALPLQFPSLIFPLPTLKNLKYLLDPYSLLSALTLYG